MKRYHFINRLVVIAGIVAVPPLIAGFFLIQHAAKARLSDAAGASFVLFAENAASAVDMAFLRELEVLTSVASMPPEARSTVHLTALEQSSPLYVDIVVLNEAGEVVVASDERERSSYADEPDFEKALRNVAPRRESNDAWAVLDEANDLLTLYVAIREADSKDVVGLVRGSMDTERLFRGVSDVRFGETGHACLIDRDSGRVIAGRRRLCASDGIYLRQQEYQRALEQGNPYFLAGVAGPASFDRGDATLVAHARPQLSRSFPALDWAVTVEQSLAETFAPLAPLSRDLVLYFLGMGVLVVLLAGFLSYRLEKPTTDVEIDLHEDRPHTTR